jgi:translation initiation factor 3 subunit K
MSDVGPDLEAYLNDLGWAIERSNSVVVIPPNPDNQIEATVVQESIKLPRKLVNSASRGQR